MKPLSPAIGLLVVVLAAVGMRAVAHAEFRAAPDTFAPVVDSEAYLLQALRVAQGHDIVDGVYFQAPLHPWVLGLALRAAGVGAGHELPDAERLVELPPEVVAHARSVGAWLNALLGVLVAVLAWRLGARLFSPGTGLAAGLLMACYGPTLFYEGHLLKVSLSLVFLPWAVLAAARAERRGKALPWLWCGLALGLGGLVRGNLHLLSPLAALALLVAGRRRGFGLAPAVALLLGTGLAIAPVVARNSVVAGEPVLSTAAGGTAFWLCNHAGNSTGLVEYTDLNRQVPRHELEDWTVRTEAETGRPMTPAEISSFWMGRALEDIRDDPGRWLFVELRKLGLLASRYEAPDNTQFALGEEVSRTLALTPARYGLLLPLALGGGLLAWLWRRREQDRPGRTALVLALGGYAASLLLFNMTSRFRMPVVVPLAVYAGYLLAHLSALAGAAGRPRLRLGLATAVLGGWLLTTLSEGPLGPLDAAELASHRATRLANRAQVALERGDEPAARSDLTEALRVGAAVGKVAPGVLVRLGALDRAAALAAEAAGQPARAAPLRAAAIRAVRQALDVSPRNGPAQRTAGLLLYDEAAYGDAIRSFEGALEAIPGDRVARQYLVLALLETGRAHDALEHAEALVAQRPLHDDGHGLAAAAAWDAGRAQEAHAHLANYDELVAERRALDLAPRLPELPVFPAVRRSDQLFEAVELQPGLAPMVCGRPVPETILEVNGGGVALFDGDGDGDLDLLLVSPGAYPSPDTPAGGTNRLYRNDGDWRFVDVTAGSGVDVAAFCNGVTVGDFDSDGQRDLYLTCWGSNVLLRNLGGLRFEAVHDAAGAAGSAAEWSTSAVFVDLDRDGDPDLYVTNYLGFDAAKPPMDGVEGLNCTWKGIPVLCGPQGLPPQADRFYRNDGGTFVDATRESGFAMQAGYGLGVLDGDFDGDGWPDLYVSNDSTPNALFLSRGDGTVKEQGALSGAALSSRGREQAGMGIAAGDTDGDLDEDLLVTNFSMEPNAFYRNSGKGSFRDDADPAGLGGPSRQLLGWGAAFVDMDLDGDLDLVNANGHVYPQADEEGTDTSYAQPDRLWRNEGGRYRVTAWPGDAPAPSRALAVGDLDDDQIVDLVILRRDGVPAVWRGLGAGGSGLQVQLVGPPGNPDGQGSVVRVTDALGARQRQVRTSAGYQAAGDPRPVFGWRGPAEVLIITPDGRELRRAVDAPGRVVLELEHP